MRVSSEKLRESEKCDSVIGKTRWNEGRKLSSTVFNLKFQVSNVKVFRSRIEWEFEVWNWRERKSKADSFGKPNRNRAWPNEKKFWAWTFTLRSRKLFVSKLKQKFRVQNSSDSNLKVFDWKIAVLERSWRQLLGHPIWLVEVVAGNQILVQISTVRVHPAVQHPL